MTSLSPHSTTGTSQHQARASAMLEQVHACTEDSGKRYPLAWQSKQENQRHNFENKAAWIQVPSSGSLFSF